MRKLLLSAAVLMSLQSLSFASHMNSNHEEEVKTTAHQVNVAELIDTLRTNPSKIAAEPELQKHLIAYLYIQGFNANITPDFDKVLPSLNANLFEDVMSTWVYIRLQQVKGAPISQALVDIGTEMAEAGNPQAQYVLGCLHDFGWKTPEGVVHAGDPTKAFGLYMEAAEQGLAEAQGAAGWMQYTGWIDEKNKTAVKADHEAGLRLLRAAVAQGNYYATRCLKILEK
jgi:TPR repeat protein